MSGPDLWVIISLATSPDGGALRGHAQKRDLEDRQSWSQCWVKNRSAVVAKNDVFIT